jgi:hypothetical protein
VKNFKKDSLYLASTYSGYNIIKYLYSKKFEDGYKKYYFETIFSKNKKIIGDIVVYQPNFLIKAYNNVFKIIFNGE